MILAFDLFDVLGLFDLGLLATVVVSHVVRHGYECSDDQCVPDVKHTSNYSLLSSTLLVTILSTRPYATASSAFMNLSRSMSSFSFCRGCPVVFS